MIQKRITDLMNNLLKKTFIVAFGFICFGMYAQNNKKMMTSEQLTWGNSEYIGVKGLQYLQWIGNNVSYVENDNLLFFNPETKSKGVFMTLQDINSIKGLGKKYDKFPYLSVRGNTKNLVGVRDNGVLKIFGIDDKVIKYNIPIGMDLQAYKISNDLKHIAIVKDNNIQIVEEGDIDYKNTCKITSDGNEKIVYGQSVHQNEFGINGGLFWSPKSDKLAFYRMDQSLVKEYPILNIYTDKELDFTGQYYPMINGDNHSVSIGVYDINTKEVVYLKTNEKDIYLTNITFSPDSKHIYVAQVNRAQNQMDMVEYNCNTGEKTKVLFTEKDDCYTEPLYPAMFVPNRDDLFIWVSRKDGFRHIYLYNTKGKMLKQITKGNWEIEDIQGFSPDGKYFFYTSTEVSPIDRNCYKVNINTGDKICLNNEDGFHQTSISPNGKFFLDTYSSQTVARRDVVGSTIFSKQISVLNDSKDPDEDYLMPQIKLGSILSADGKTKLYCKTIYPPNFDETKKYPCIIYVYNGPHAQLVQNTRRLSSMPFSMIAANNGYIVFTVDGRGSAARGARFEQVIHRQLGKNEMEDQLKGVEYLKSLPYIDKDRIGVYGWSYGGFMSINLMLTYPEIFKVGVAGGPVTNWEFYEIMYGERYMDTPKENPEGYKQSNLLLRAGDLKGRLLVIHGTNDPVVMWQHSLAFVKSCVDGKSYPDYMVYPGHLHNVTGKDRVHLNNTIIRYFNDHLGNK